LRPGVRAQRAVKVPVSLVKSVDRRLMRSTRVVSAQCAPAWKDGRAFCPLHVGLAAHSATAIVFQNVLLSNVAASGQDPIKSPVHMDHEFYLFA
jgi:hypothetical protein